VRTTGGIPRRGGRQPASRFWELRALGPCCSSPWLPVSPLRPLLDSTPSGLTSSTRRVAQAHLGAVSIAGESAWPAWCGLFDGAATQRRSTGRSKPRSSCADRGRARHRGTQRPGSPRLARSRRCVAPAQYASITRAPVRSGPMWGSSVQVRDSNRVATFDPNDSMCVRWLMMPMIGGPAFGRPAGLLSQPSAVATTCSRCHRM
jgi:hypothetical protein